MDLEIVTPGNQVNNKIGNPIQIGVDGIFIHRGGPMDLRNTSHDFKEYTGLAGGHILIHRRR